VFGEDAVAAVEGFYPDFAEGLNVRGFGDGSCTPSGVRILWNCNPGWSSLSLLDPALISVIPAGIKKLLFYHPN
jgi:hypothetical protein